MSGSVCLTDTPPPEQYNNVYPHDTRHSLEYTYSLDRLSCVRQAYFVHITLAYLVFLSGLACIIARLVPSLHQWHAMFGRLYILCMLWCMATSLLAHNVGLPVGVLVSFFIVLMGLSLGWVCIKVHQEHMRQKIVEKVDELWLSATDRSEPPSTLMSKAKQSIFSHRNLKERMLSYKAAHGALMFMSWINITGRLFASNQSGDFTCHTYPVYKQLDSAKFTGFNQPLTYVPIEDRNNITLPWSHSLIGWGVEMSIGPLVVGLFAGFMFTWGVSKSNGPTHEAHQPPDQPATKKSMMPRISPR